MALRYTPVVDDHLLLVTRLCEQFFSTKNTFLTVSVITKLAKIKKQEYLIRAHCVRHVKYAMQRMSRDRLLQSITADSLLAPAIFPLLEEFSTCPRQSIEEFEMSLLLGSSSLKPNCLCFVSYINRNRFRVRSVSPVWLSHLFEIKVLHRRVRLTEQRQRKGGELETRWLKASTGRVTDSALGRR